MNGARRASMPGTVGFVVAWRHCSALAVLAIGHGRKPAASPVVMGELVRFLRRRLRLAHLIGAPERRNELTLPLGLPWVGAHFRLDALSTFFGRRSFNLGGAGA